jgi:hypothetical protein
LISIIGSIGTDAAGDVMVGVGGSVVIVFSSLAHSAVFNMVMFRGGQAVVREVRADWAGSTKGGGGGGGVGTSRADLAVWVAGTESAWEARHLGERVDLFEGELLVVPDF